MRSNCKGQLDFAKNPLKAFTKFNHIVLDAIILSLVGKEFKYTYTTIFNSPCHFHC